MTAVLVLEGRMTVEVHTTALLQRAFEEASKRSAEEQDFLATMLVAELEAENAFDRAIACSADKLCELSKQAIEEDRAGLTEELDPDRL